MDDGFPTLNPAEYPALHMSFDDRGMRFRERIARELLSELDG